MTDIIRVFRNINVTELNANVDDFISNYSDSHRVENIRTDIHTGTNVFYLTIHLKPKEK